MQSILRAVARERAVIFGLALAAVTYFANGGQITKETAVPVIAGIILRFFVSPVDRPALRNPDPADHADHVDPEAFHEGA